MTKIVNNLNIKKIEEDVSRQKPLQPGSIDKVGIEGLDLPINIKDGPRELSLPAHISAMVSLDQPHTRGIHMSRIYLKLHHFLAQKNLSLKAVKELLPLLVQSQNKLSQTAYLKFEWQRPVKRPALKTSDLAGWRFYPVFYEGQILKDGSTQLVMGFKVTYSSTCPCSASLARRLIQQKFKKDFALEVKNLEVKNLELKNQGPLAHKKPKDNPKPPLVDTKQVFTWLGKESSISATPHAQKSHAFVKLKVKREEQGFIELINEVEQVLGTPVQTAVKQEDEQEFARLNSENLMFSEDATRRIKALLNQKTWVTDFYIHVQHFESLHPFEVACHATKQVPGGWRA